MCITKYHYYQSYHFVLIFYYFYKKLLLVAILVSVYMTVGRGFRGGELVTRLFTLMGLHMGGGFNVGFYHNYLNLSSSSI